MYQTAKEYFSRLGVSEAILAYDAKLYVENGFTFIVKFYLTLTSVRLSGPFNGLGYLLTKFQINRLTDSPLHFWEQCIDWYNGYSYGSYRYGDGYRDDLVYYNTGIKLEMKFMSRLLDRKLLADHFL